jgi:hypothetical protein
VGPEEPFHRARPALAIVFCTVLALLGGCSGPDVATRPAAPPTPVESGPPPEVLTAPVIGPGDAVPLPVGEPVLTVTGRIALTNDTAVLRLDQATLDRLGLVLVSVYEPWVKQNMQFQGVWLADLIKLTRPDGNARTVHLTALDDYQIDLTMADVTAGGILLATRTGSGGPIAVEDGGPTRIVFVSGTPAGSSADQWIWSLASIDVR